MELDPRGQRFAAVLTSIVIALVLITGSGWLALAQALVFAVTAWDPRRGPYPMIYRALVLPRLGPPAEREAAAPVRFAQTVGFAFLGLSAAGYLAGAETLGVVAAAFGLLAAFLNAAFGLCLGCEAYLLIRRLSSRNAESVRNV
ncbi:membrane protein [Actinoplanes lobatus]|uniref:Membrane protein n=1 Tax=Actinoplanes lobatus TaxID=113568 RepID=A0A7W7MGK3_9ACTN|nr:DUF4395 domain-containing protein [Actinoplanes lobatus]MBB4749386.1 hypothetical protein [Actinoplanes lobatus]GGN91296.1 membrane protein [Actinoplanes lobatus]GIE40327.1 membrane protein [Actinoplanes lobatus]